VIENGLLANTFEGFGLGNINFGTGPDGRWEWPSVTDRPYMFSRDDWAPIGYKGFYAWDATTPGEGQPIAALTDLAGTNVPGSQGYDPQLPADFILGSSEDEEDTDPPTVTSNTPATGPNTGGTRVTITGTNLLGTTDVKFGGVSGTNLTVTSDTSLKVTSPAHAAGPVAIDVTTEDGTGTKATAFTYDA